MEEKKVWMIEIDNKVLSEDGNWVEFTNNRALRFQTFDFAMKYLNDTDLEDGVVTEHIFEDVSKMTTTTPIMKHFTIEPSGKLYEVSSSFCQVAQFVDAYLPPGPEKTVCLRKLLEAKDAGVRAAI